MRTETRLSVLAILATSLVVAGCAHYQRNAPVTAVNPQAGYRFHHLSQGQNSDRLFVILSFSGGGTRAAALAYGALKKLAEIEISGGDGGRTTLLAEVDVISSVSGGSFTAAYYALFGPEKLFAEFERAFLRRNIQGALKRQLLNPANWFRLASPHYDRSDLAADFYHREIFEGKTFGDLMEKGERPYVIVNATDMTQGHRFEFTQDQFDLLCSDLTSYPIARAVASSSAFPGLLTPLTLDNYANRCGFRIPEWVRNAREDRQLNPRRYIEAEELASYVEENRPYIHLVDGGVSDNIGLRGPIHALTSNDSPWSLVNKINNREVERVVVIVVNAKTQAERRWDERKNAPWLLPTLQTAAGTPMSHYSFETVERVKEYFEEQRRDNELVRALRESCPDCPLIPSPVDVVQFHVFEISFDEVEDVAERRELNHLPTTFTLPDEAVDRLIQVGPMVLDRNEEFQRLIQELNSP